MLIFFILLKTKVKKSIQNLSTFHSSVKIESSFPNQIKLVYRLFFSVLVKNNLQINIVSWNEKIITGFTKNLRSFFSFGKALKNYHF